jgi:hypothetical protein
VGRTRVPGLRARLVGGRVSEPTLDIYPDHITVVPLVEMECERCLMSDGRTVDVIHPAYMDVRGIARNAWIEQMGGDKEDGKIVGAARIPVPEALA